MWVSNKSGFWWRHFLSLSLKLRKFISYKPRQIRVKTILEPKFEVMLVYESQTKAISHEGICWDSVWSYLSLRGLNNSEFLWRHLLSLSLKLCKFMSFKKRRIREKTFLDPQFEVMLVYEFQTKAISYEGICWVSLWSFLSLRGLDKS